MNHPAVHILREPDGMRSNRLTIYKTIDEAYDANYKETEAGALSYVIEEVSDIIESQWEDEL